MGLTPEEFFRALPCAVGELEYRVEGSRAAITHPEGTIDIHLTLASDRHIGALRLPVTHVEFVFSELSKLGQECFMDNLDLHFHRGGG